MKPKFAACLAMVCIMLLPLSARAANESVTLITGETIEARFIDHHWRGGQEYFVFATPGGVILSLIGAESLSYRFGHSRPVLPLCLSPM